MLSAIGQGIGRKTAKDQMDNSPDQDWLAVILEGTAGWQLSGTLGAG